MAETNNVERCGIQELQSLIFDEIRNLKTADQTDEQMRAAVQRAEAVKGLAGVAIDNAALALSVVKTRMNMQVAGDAAKVDVPKMLGA